jgi:LPXTG-motif cell wall-anchored protein
MKLKRHFDKTTLPLALVISIAIPSSVSAFTYPIGNGYNYRSVKDGVTEITETHAPTYYNTENYSPDDPLGAATHFHIFAKDDLRINAHTNGNVATNFMSLANSNSGTNGYYTIYLQSEVSYVKDFGAIHGQIINDARSHFIVGPDVEVDTYDNGNGFTIRGSDMSGYIQMNNATVKNLFQETKDGPAYIDMDAEFAYLGDLSKQLALAKPTDTEEIINTNDMNNRWIALDMSKDCTVIELDAAQLVMNTDLKLRNYDPIGSNSVIINVDLKNYSGDVFNLNSKISLVTTDGKSIASAERTTWEYGKILWNFYDSSKEDYLFDGTIKTDGVFLGTILAPDAEVTLGQNLNGSVICRVFQNNAETHRTDFTGNLPKTKGRDATTTTTTTTTTTVTTTETTTETTVETTTETRSEVTSTEDTASTETTTDELPTETTTEDKTTEFTTSGQAIEVTTLATEETTEETTAETTTVTAVETTETATEETEVTTETTTDVIEDTTVVTTTVTVTEVTAVTTTKKDDEPETRTKRPRIPDYKPETTTNKETTEVTTEVATTTNITTEATTRVTTEATTEITTIPQVPETTTETTTTTITTAVNLDETETTTRKSGGATPATKVRTSGGGSASNKGREETVTEATTLNLVYINEETTEADTTHVITTETNITDEDIFVDEPNEIILPEGKELGVAKDRPEPATESDTVITTSTQTVTVMTDGLPQTGTPINTAVLYGTGIGAISLGIFFALKGKNKSA